MKWRWTSSNSHEEVNYLTQLLSENRGFRKYFPKFKHEETSECLTCTREEEDTERVLQVPMLQLSLQYLGNCTRRRVPPGNLEEPLLFLDAAWDATRIFGVEFLKGLFCKDQGRKKRNKTKEEGRIVFDLKGELRSTTSLVE